MAVGEGELVAVVGVVGSGKSSLIQTCLGEMQRDEGRVRKKVRENIIYYHFVSRVSRFSLSD